MENIRDCRYRDAQEPLAVLSTLTLEVYGCAPDTVDRVEDTPCCQKTGCGYEHG